MEYLKFLVDQHVLTFCTSHIRIDSQDFSLIFQDLDIEYLFEYAVETVHQNVNSGNIILNSNDDDEEGRTTEIQDLTDEMLENLDWNTVLNPEYTRIEAFCLLRRVEDRNSIFLTPRQENRYEIIDPRGLRLRDFCEAIFRTLPIKDYEGQFIKNVEISGNTVLIETKDLRI